MSRPKGFPTPYQRIMENVRKAMGVRLSRDEVFAMSMDNAIEAVALDDDEREEAEKGRER